jgi:hypothetical protein
MALADRESWGGKWARHIDGNAFPAASCSSTAVGIIMVHQGRIALDFAGLEREKLRIGDLMEAFTNGAGGAADNTLLLDRIAPKWDERIFTK